MTAPNDVAVLIAVNCDFVFDHRFGLPDENDCILANGENFNIGSRITRSAHIRGLQLLFPIDQPEVAVPPYSASMRSGLLRRMTLIRSTNVRLTKRALPLYQSIRWPGYAATLSCNCVLSAGAMQMKTPSS